MKKWNWYKVASCTTWSRRYSRGISIDIAKTLEWKFGNDIECHLNKRHQQQEGERKGDRKKGGEEKGIKCHLNNRKEKEKESERERKKLKEGEGAEGWRGGREVRGKGGRPQLSPNYLHLFFIFSSSFLFSPLSLLREINSFPSIIHLLSVLGTSTSGAA